MHSSCTNSSKIRDAYQEGCDDGEEGAEAQHDGISDALIQQRLASEEACVSGTHPIHHGVVLGCPWQPRWACRRHRHPPRRWSLQGTRSEPPKANGIENEGSSTVVYLIYTARHTAILHSRTPNSFAKCSMSPAPYHRVSLSNC